MCGIKGYAIGQEEITAYRGPMSWWFEYRPDCENASVP